MKYAILIYDENTADPATEPTPIPRSWAEVMGSYNAFTKEINEARASTWAARRCSRTRRRRRSVSGTARPSPPMARSPRPRRAWAASTSSTVKDLDEALALKAAKCCPASWHGTVEVRPVVEFEDEEPEGTIEHKAVGAA